MIQVAWPRACYLLTHLVWMKSEDKFRSNKLLNLLECLCNHDCEYLQYLLPVIGINWGDSQGVNKMLDLCSK